MLFNENGSIRPNPEVRDLLNKINGENDGLVSKVADKTKICIYSTLNRYLEGEIIEPNDYIRLLYAVSEELKQKIQAIERMISTIETEPFVYSEKHLYY